MFPNGSEVVVGGLDAAQKVMSTEFDLIYVQEAIELTEDDWELLTTRLRNGRMTYQQLIADTNPSFPRHWLKRRCNDGRTQLIESRHQDNPAICDPRTGTPTPFGEAYLAKLDALTGARKPRLRFGLWAQAEGSVYENWDAATHLISQRPIPPHWLRYWSIDFGFTNPFVWQFWAEDDDGGVHLYREIYQTGQLVEDLARQGLALCDGEPRPQSVVCDHDAEDRATFERYTSVRTEPANKGVQAGIQEVAGRLTVRRNGRPQLFIHRDARAHPADPTLVAAAKPTCTVEEFDGYVWDRARASGEAPLKKDDHGMDAMRYLCRKLSEGPSGRAEGYGGDPDADPFGHLPPGVFD
jgi:phage terminase large subunit